MAKIQLFLSALRIYWKSLFVIIYPLILLPVFIFNNVPQLRCLYVVLLMAGYWVFETLPLPVTSLIPMVLFPVLGILDSNKTSLCYLKETNMMFVGGLVIAIAVEHCNLHTRVALNVIRLVGCSPRRLNFGLITVTMLVSMWISNTAATAMMIPIIEATLRELETQGIFEMYESNTLNDIDTKQPSNQTAEEQKKPTKTTMCYFISTAYASSIGGLGSIVGSGTNLTFKGLYENIYKDSPGIEFVKWMFLNVPMMLLMMYISLIWLQFWFMGLFRPNSNDAKKIKASSQAETVARKIIGQKIKEMGPMTFHEWAVAVMFCLSVILWFFRQPQFIWGWSDHLVHHFVEPEMKRGFKIKDATAALIVVLMLFVIPAKPDFIYCLSRDESKRPKAASQALITWKVVQQKLPWGLIFLLGGGFALAEGSDATKMSDMIADYLAGFASLPPFTVMAVSTIFATILTQFSSNVAVANVLLPVLSSISRKARVHPIYLMMPTALACSFAYTLPVSTPPNAIAAAPCNMSSKEMAKAGFGVTIICLLILFGIFPFLGSIIWDFEVFPDWAGSSSDSIGAVSNITQILKCAKIPLNSTWAANITQILEASRGALNSTMV